MGELDDDALLASDFGLVSGGKVDSQKSLKRRGSEQKLIIQFGLK